MQNMVTTRVNFSRDIVATNLNLMAHKFNNLWLNWSMVKKFYLYLFLSGRYVGKLILKNDLVNLRPTNI